MELKNKVLIAFILLLLFDILITIAIVGGLYQAFGGELSFSAYLASNFWGIFGIMSAILAFGVGISLIAYTETKDKKPKKPKKPKEDMTFYSKYRVPIIIIIIISIIVIATLIQFFF